MSRFSYSFARYPQLNKILDRQLEAASGRLENKLSKLEIPDGAISPFIKGYFERNLNYIQTVLQRYVFLLSWALQYQNTSNLKDLTMVDYGGGSGMLSLLSKEIGIGTVVYIDIYDVCCNDARCIARTLGLEADYYVHGDIDDLIAFLRENNIICDVIVSYDTLEHIYDIDDFFDKVPRISDGPLIFTMASGANSLNPLISRRLMRLQRKVEFEGKIRDIDDDERNPEEPLIAIRRKIIEKHGSVLNSSEIEMLARNTRGMMINDINQTINIYLSDGVFPEDIEHPTNTCDPMTGNWCEQLLDPNKLAQKLNNKRFNAKVLSGYYGSVIKDSEFKRFARNGLNLAISLLGQAGLRIAPYYCIYAVRNVGVQ